MEDDDLAKETLEWETAQLMMRQGGSFVQALGATYRAADPINRARLRREFADYFERYEQFVKQIKLRRQEAGEC